VIYGEEGQIQVGRFDQQPVTITVNAYGRRGGAEPIAHRVFSLGPESVAGPEFLDRFGPAYRAEIREFVDCCRGMQPFPVTHRDGVRAQRVITAGMRNAIVPLRITD
jgi:predicted dehydrogenase